MSEPATEPVTAPDPAPAPPAAVAPSTTGQRLILAFIAVLVLVAVGIGVGLYVNRTPAQMTVNGSMIVESAFVNDDPSAPLPTAGDSCPMDTGYSDLPGSQVVIADDTGHSLGLGSLGQPVFLTPPTLDSSGFVQEGGTCTMSFTVTKIRDGKAIYTITVGRRGSVKFTLSEMKAGPVLDIQ